MKSFIESLLEHVDSRTSLTFGDGNSDLKLQELPRDVDGVYAIDSPAPEPDRETPWRYATVTFWARYRNSATCYEKLNEIYDIIERNYQYEVGTDTKYLVAFSHCITGIENQDRDQENGGLYSLATYFIYRPLDIIS